jgi:hypothetical protein
MPLAEDLADPDMCGHLWPGADPGAPGAFGAVDAFGDGLAAAEEGVAEEVPDRVGVEEVEALAMLSPSARVAPSTAPPAAVPARGLLILTRFSLRRVLAPGRGPGTDRVTRHLQWAKPS